MTGGTKRALKWYHWLFSRQGWYQMQGKGLGALNGVSLIVFMAAGA